MVSNNPFIIVLLYLNCRMRNGDYGVTFECHDPILFRTQRVETLSDLRSLILSKVGGTQAREIRRVAYRLLAPMGNGAFRFRLFRLHGDEHVRLMFDIHGRIMCEQVMEQSAKVGHGGSGSSAQDTYVQDDRPLAPPPIHVAIPEHEAKEGEEESDENYMADSGDSESSDGGDEDEFVLETHAGAVPRHVLPPPHPIPALSAVPIHYHSLDLDAMHERILNREGIPKMRVTHCDRWASVFVVEELEPFEGWGQGSFRVRLSEGTCDCVLFQSLHYPCRHALAGCTTASIEWVPYVHPVYRQEAVFKVYEMEFPPIPDELLFYF
ncbi:hypothetical protein Ahy_B08g089380 [Arachis hypogaea]|uniref:SWIM-type domain-containing protein n=1 Tax=Arachis hypogaea TaxID=3818 RepID=A0A444XXS3_ARAHY|nr:hypothetical protein Ahy_B08g089380 [Arachis hypogaea]